MNDEPDVAADAPLAFVIADQARIVVADKMRQGGYAQARPRRCGLAAPSVSSGLSGDAGDGCGVAGTAVPAS